MKKIMLVLGLFVIMQNQVQSQRPVGPRPDQMPGQRPDTSGVKKDIHPVKTGPKAYGEVITKKAVSQKGVFTVHFLDDKFYFDIPDQLMGRELLAVTRFVKVPGGARKYGGEEVNQQSILFE